jgi:hypothetical protein
MDTDIQEIYQKTISPLPDKEKLEIATLILEEVTRKAEGNKRQPSSKGGIREMFGTWQGKESAQEEYLKLDHNERIDFDLAKSYLELHENED